MARIAIILGRLSVGGATRVALDTARYWQQHHEVLLITGEPGAEEGSAGIMLQGLDKVQHISLQGFHRTLAPWQHVQTYRKLRQILRQFRPHQVHTHTPVAGLTGRLAAASLQVPMVVHFYHGFLFSGYYGSITSRLIRLVERWLAGKTDLLMVLSQGQQKQLVHSYHIAPAEKVRVAPAGINPADFADPAGRLRTLFRQQYRLDEHQLAIGMVGRLVAVKNPAFLLETVARLLPAFPGLRLFYVGDGPLAPALQQQCAQLGLPFSTPQHPGNQATVTFCSWQENMPMVMAGLDVVALSSVSEGTPLCIMEAMAAGKPVVSTAVGAIPEMVEDGINGFLVAENDLPAYLGALKRLLADANLRAAMGQNATARAQNSFNQQHGLENLSQLLDLANEFKVV
ncbi:MAG: glycosyltransferase [Chitinophagaceae bacterium]|nr:glycosyltransferase [Chitinophagaceae bacterium]